MSDVVQTFQNEMAAVERANLISAEGYRRKADIVRRTLVSEWLPIFGLRRTLNLLRKPDLADQPGIGIAQDAITAEINAHLANVAAAKGVLDQMVILPPPSFPLYWQLPPELRVQVLRFLTSAKDKLSLAEAFLGEAVLMNWDMLVLQREAAKELEPLALGNWQKIGEQRSGSPDRRSLINQQFARHVEEENFCEKTYKDPSETYYLKQMPAATAFDGWHPADPITAPVNLFIENVMLGNTPDPFNEFIREGQVLGPRIWGCRIEFFGLELPMERLAQWLAQSLVLLPNLRKLVVQMDKGIFILPDQEEGEWAAMENIAMPALPSLAILKFFGGRGTKKGFLLRRKLLHAYGAQLKYFRVEVGSHVESRFIQELPVFGQLNSCEVTDSHNWQFYCEMFEKLQTCPLKVLKCSVYPPHGSLGFPDFLETLCRFFGGTLEHLAILLDNLSWKPGRMPNPWKESLANISFSKLKHLKIDASFCSVGWELLLLFPALETLQFGKYLRDKDDMGRSIQRPTGGRQNAGQAPEPTLDARYLFTSSIWKLLPNLREILVEEGQHDIPDEETGTAVPAKITRDDSIEGMDYTAFMNWLGNAASVAHGPGEPGEPFPEPFNRAWDLFAW